MENVKEMFKRETKKLLKAAHKNPLLEKLKAKRKRTLSRSLVRRHCSFPVLRNSK
ncbi:unknown protein [Simkania negevensis Z]|jgi:hypothetical protein|uniref:Uncharacterized protein n=1 Tax=Simkania negevensis (strain ATCC VR-1471 / DSM 27360 / Z) TaxID=331113 RepID=F8L7V9_SIMNZ|nr:unknown protein [Simkania negevensis Z]